jgi:hypothetical protein
VIVATQLAVEVRAWTVRYLDGRDPRSTEGDVMGPVQYLRLHSGWDERQIARLTADELRTVNLSAAESMLSAIDREYMLSNGEIHVIPNPNWSFEKWVDHMKGAGCL